MKMHGLRSLQQTSEMIADSCDKRSHVFARKKETIYVTLKSFYKTFVTFYFQLFYHNVFIKCMMFFVEKILENSRM